MERSVTFSLSMRTFLRKPSLEASLIRYPTGLTVLKLDDVLFVRPYGEPSRQGRHSPWLLLDGTQLKHPWVSFINDFVNFAMNKGRSEFRDRS